MLSASAWIFCEENWGPLVVQEAITANTAYTATYLFDGSTQTMNLYVNGSPVGSDTINDAFALYAHGGDVGIGAMVDKSYFLGDSQNGNGFYFEGNIGEITHFDRALDSGELSQIHTYLGDRWLVTQANQPPIAQDDTISVTPSANSFDLFADNGAGADSDPDNGTLTVTEVNGVPLQEMVR